MIATETTEKQRRKKMKKLKENLTDARRIPFEIAAPTSARFKKFCLDMFGVRVDEMPTEQGIFMKQSLSLVFYATIMFLITNGFYLVKNLISNNSPAIDMIPLYMMVISSAAMLIFTVCYKKYDTQTARFALLAYYVMIIASVTVFMVSCNYHNIGLSISMCYLFIIMVAPTYKLSDTVALCVLIAIGAVLPRYLPYGENYNLFKHSLLRLAIIAGFVAVRSVFIRQSTNELKLKEMSNAFITLAFTDITTGTLNKKAMEVYREFVNERILPEKASVVIYDIDDFKSYNDHYSHVRGDKVLKRISECVIGVLEKTEFYLFRFGGEEFVIILPDVAEDEAARFSLEMLNAIRSAAISRADLEGKDVVTASFGVACGEKDELKDLSVLIRADKQLYVCKSSGKNCVAASDEIFR